MLLLLLLLSKVGSTLYNETRFFLCSRHQIMSGPLMSCAACVKIAKKGNPRGCWQHQQRTPPPISLQRPAVAQYQQGPQQLLDDDWLASLPDDVLFGRTPQPAPQWHQNQPQYARAPQPREPLTHVPQPWQHQSPPYIPPQAHQSYQPLHYHQPVRPQAPMPPQAPQMPQELAPPRMAYPSQAQHWHGGGDDDDDDDKPLSHRRLNRAPDVGGPAGSLSAPPLRGAPMPSSHLAVASSGGMPARADACPGAVSPARSVPGVAYAPAKVATAAVVKAVSQSPVTAPVDATKLERPAWLEAFRAHLVTVCSDANVRSVMRTITVLASGDGLPHPDGTSPPFHGNEAG